VCQCPPPPDRARQALIGRTFMGQPHVCQQGCFTPGVGATLTRPANVGTRAAVMRVSCHSNQDHTFDRPPPSDEVVSCHDCCSSWGGRRSTQPHPAHTKASTTTGLLPLPASPHTNQTTATHNAGHQV
jgi:hypothetical protein